ncbi:hypothetical protein HK096_002042, partial [Nowakowskiella sp. JEL0078]
VVPSIPGFGFSSRPETPGFGVNDIARIFNKLMCSLGYNKYVAQGGDWGSVITRTIAMQFPKNCLGFHVNLAIADPPPLTSFLLYINPQLVLSKNDLYSVAKYQQFIKTGMGYYAIQSTKPHMLAYGLTDSPIGLLGWIGEMLRSPAGFISKDEVLTNLMIYWISKSIYSSMLIYKEESVKKFSGFWTDYCSVPMGYSAFPQ